MGAVAIMIAAAEALIPRLIDTLTRIMGPAKLTAPRIPIYTVTNR